MINVKKENFTEICGNISSERIQTDDNADDADDDAAALTVALRRLMHDRPGGNYSSNRCKLCAAAAALAGQARVECCLACEFCAAQNVRSRISCMLRICTLSWSIVH